MQAAVHPPAYVNGVRLVRVALGCSAVRALVTTRVDPGQASVGIAAIRRSCVLPPPDRRALATRADQTRGTSDTLLSARATVQGVCLGEVVALRLGVAAAVTGEQIALGHG